MKYNTKHRYQLIEYLNKNKDRHLTVQEMQNDLPEIPVATLYRLIDSLLEEGVLRKYIIGPNSSCCFQYNENGCQNHFHLICEKCGKLIHLHCDEVENLITHINDEHGFNIDTSKINLYGICEDCQKRNEQ